MDVDSFFKMIYNFKQQQILPYKQAVLSREGECAAMKLYKRQYYLQKIREYYQDNDLIKIMTGIRGCGKSCMMEMIMNELRWRGNAAVNLIHIDLDTKEFKNIKNAERLRIAIKEKCVPSKDGTIYLFIDEIQMIDGFETLLESLYNEGRYSIFLSASSSYILSEAFEAAFHDRYQVFEIFPLSYAEYEGMKDFNNIKKESNPILEFGRYVHDGGLPGVLMCQDAQEKQKYVNGVLDEIFKKDIAKMEKIRHVVYFKQVQDYVIETFGESVSMTRLTDYFRNYVKIPVKRETLERYLELLEKAKLVYRCNRFDIKTEKELQGDQRYYLTDLGFYFAKKTDSKVDYSLIMRNVIYMYLRSRDYNIATGRIGKRECDFVLTEYMTAGELPVGPDDYEDDTRGKRSKGSKVVAQAVAQNSITERVRAYKASKGLLDTPVKDDSGRPSAKDASGQNSVKRKMRFEEAEDEILSESNSMSDVLSQYLDARKQETSGKPVRRSRVETMEVDDEMFDEYSEDAAQERDDERSGRRPVRRSDDRVDERQDVRAGRKSAQRYVDEYDEDEDYVEDDYDDDEYVQEQDPDTPVAFYRYIKFAMTTADPYREQIEYAALDSIHGRSPKFMLTLDSETQEHGSITHLNAIVALKEEYDFNKM